VRYALIDEIARGRIESDGNGRVRLRPGALPVDLVQALAAFAEVPQGLLAVPWSSE
jgi:hypothetical protein